jgi:Mn2+/Fe2+ NRAMP family transporter
VRKRKGATAEELKHSRSDITKGMFFSNLIAYFIILTTARTLHQHGHADITTAKQAAEALRPFAGEGAYLLFAAGVIGAGMIGIPVLAGSSAYAWGEAAGWRSSLNEKVMTAKEFYAVVAISMAIGMALDWFGFNAVGMLFWSAVLNGLLAPPLIVIVLLLTSDSNVMGEHANGPILKWLGWATVATMAVSAIMLVLSWAKGV